MRKKFNLTKALGVCIVMISTSIAWSSTPTVKLYPLKIQTSKQTITAYGSTISPLSVIVRAQSNAQIQSINFKPGQMVKAGQVLFQLKSSDIDNQPEKLRAAYVQAKSYYNRLVHANKSAPGSVARYDLLKAKTTYQQALAAFQESAVISKIRAPISGQISDTDLTVGSYVTDNQQLAQIITPQHLEVKYQLPSQYMSQAKVEQNIKFKPTGMKQTYSGKVMYVAPYVSDDYGLTIRADLQNASGLRPNQFGQITQVVNPNFKSLLVPQALVQTDSKGFYVYTLSGKKVAQSYFKPGSVTSSGLVQVLSGLTTKTLVIDAQGSALSPGESVQVAS